MSKVQLFDHAEFGKVRTVVIDGVLWFFLPDVARILGYRDAERASRLLRHSQLNTLSKGIWADLQGRGKPPLIITESGLYRLLMRTDSPVAEPFQDWITDELLPSIRRDGFYLPDTMSVAQRERAAEMIKYREAKDMLTLATDYEPSSESARRAFTRIQDMFLHRVTGMHAPELRASREIVTWTGKRGPTKADRAVAKNYLTPDELTQLSGYSDIAVGRIKVGYPRAGYTVAEFWDVVRRVALEG